jgi:hypothetical protein
MPGTLEAVVIVAILVCFIFFGIVEVTRAIKRRSISTSSQNVTPSSVDFWLYVFGYLFAFGMGTYGLLRFWLG